MSDTTKFGGADVSDPDSEKLVSKSPFEWVRAVTIEKMIADEDDLKSFEPFMVTKIVSMSEILLPIAEVATQLKHVTKMDMYRFYSHSLPQAKFFSKFLAKKEDAKSILRKKLLSEHFGIGSRDVLSMLTILSNEEIENILGIYPEWTTPKKKKTPKKKVK